VSHPIGLLERRHADLQQPVHHVTQLSHRVEITRERRRAVGVVLLVRGDGVYDA